MMNVNYVYPEFYYPVYPEYFYSYYEPIKPRQSRRNTYTFQNTTTNSDIDNSVKQIIQISKDQIAKEREINETKITTTKESNYNKNINMIQTTNQSNINTNYDSAPLKTDQQSPVIGETNRLAKHIVEILENIYQNSSFVNRKRREEIAVELNLPIEKVRNWFQNRRGKDRRQNQLQKISSRKYIRSGKYARRSEDFIYYDQKYSEAGSLIDKPVEVNVGLTNPLYINSSNGLNITFNKPTEIVADSPEKVRINEDDDEDEYDTESPSFYSNTMPYWPSNEWNNINNMQNNLISLINDVDGNDDIVCDDDGDDNSEDYEIFIDQKTNKTYLVLNDIGLDTC